MLLGRDKKSKPQPRMHVRKLFEGTLVRDASNPRSGDLSVKKGAHCTVVDKHGEVTGTNYDAGARLWANIGDRLILNGPTLEEIANSLIVAIRPDLTLRVEITCGCLAPTTTQVRVLFVKGAA
jgi:hypothetical protein